MDSFLWVWRKLDAGAEATGQGVIWLGKTVARFFNLLILNVIGWGGILLGGFFIYVDFTWVYFYLMLDKGLLLVLLGLAYFIFKGLGFEETIKILEKMTVKQFCPILKSASLKPRF